MFEPTFPCVSITPLGRPVEPEVKMIVSRSSSVSSVSPSRRSSHQTGASQVMAAAASLSVQVTLSLKSSMNTSSALSVRLSFSITRRLVKTWRMPHWAMQSLITSGGERVVEIDGHAAVERQGGVGHQRGGRGGQQQAHVPLIRRQHLAAQEPAEDQRPHEQARPGKLDAGGVGHFRPPHPPPAHAEEPPRQDQVVAGSIAHKWLIARGLVAVFL